MAPWQVLGSYQRVALSPGGQWAGRCAGSAGFILAGTGRPTHVWNSAGLFEPELKLRGYSRRVSSAPLMLCVIVIRHLAISVP